MTDTQVLNYQVSKDSAGIAVPADDGEPTWAGLKYSTWVKVGLIAGLMVATFWPNLRRLWEKTNPFTGEANWGHAIAVPFIGFYYLYVHRDELRSTPIKTAWSGLVILLGGVLVFGYGIWPGQNDFIKDFGMVVTLFGVVTMLCGWRVLRLAAFPILFLICAIPWPGLVYSRVAGPLQQLAAQVAVWVLDIARVDSPSVFGTKISYVVAGQTRTLNVAEACAGLRSLMTFIAVGGAVAFLSSRALWQKVIVMASAVPIAIFCNVMRVSGQGLIDRYVSHELSEGFAHQFVGLVMLVPAFLFILLIGWMLDQIFVEEAGRRKPKTNQIYRRGQTGQPVVAALPAGGARDVTRTATTAQARPAVIPPRPQSTAAAAGSSATLPRVNSTPLPRPAVQPVNSVRRAPATGGVPARPATMPATARAAARPAATASPMPATTPPRPQNGAVAAKPVARATPAAPVTMPNPKEGA
jgi:exosortase